jgi:Flp pilus assembly protein TadD
LAGRRGDEARAQAAFARARRRSPSDWWLRAELALLDQRSKRPADARAQLRRAQELNPTSRQVRSATAAARSGVDERISRALAQLDVVAVRSPLGRRPLECRPVLGLAGACTVQRSRG